MRTNGNKQQNTTSDLAMSMLATWEPAHRSLEVEAAEMTDMAERDTAARVAFQHRQIREH